MTDDTPLDFASEQFNSAVVALEVAWLRLFADAGCLPEEQKQAAAAAVSAYTATLQQSLADTGYYTGAVDGVYGPDTVAAVEALQTANASPLDNKHIYLTHLSAAIGLLPIQAAAGTVES